MSNSGIIYLQKDKFSLYVPTATKNIEFRFVPEIVKDLDVINLELLENLIKLFITNSKVPPMTFTIILADNACFIKDFIKTPQNPNQTVPGQPQPPIDEKADQEIKKNEDDFIDHVPFDNVVSKTLPLGNGEKIIAVNKDLLDAIASSFEKIGSKINMVLPGIVFGNNIGIAPALNQVTVNLILSQEDSLRDYDFLNKEVYQPILKDKPEKEDFYVKDDSDAPKSNKRLFIMIGVFVLLIIVLIVVYLNAPK